MDVTDRLRVGELAVEGRLTVASNLTLLAQVQVDGLTPVETLRCVYKPVSGEAPLWDFPDGSLAGREVAAYEVSEAAGWHVVPPTVLRSDGPYGPGMCQLWLDHAKPALVDVLPPSDVTDGWLPILQAVDEQGDPVAVVHADNPALRRMALFDVVVNNADRKGGHVLADGQADEGGSVLGVDHGVTFHVEPKLRTVLWGWAGSSLTDDERSELIRLRSLLDGPLADRLDGLISADEIDATTVRIDKLLTSGALPMPTGRMPIPWPVF